MTRAFVLAWGIAVLAVSAPAFAQGRGNGQGQGQGKGQGKGQGHQTNPPPSRSDLPAPGVAPPATAAAVTPFAWIDDATLLDPGTVSIAMSIVRWQGAAAHEVDAPILDVAIGVTRRVHLTALVPRVVGSADPLGAAGGAGTSYIGAKIAVVDSAKHAFKFSVTPTLEVLSRGVIETLGSTESRVHTGLPVSAELDRGPARLYAGTGYFSRGIWFAGGGGGMRVSDKMFASIGFNRSWRTSDAADVSILNGARTELTGGASYAMAPNLSVFGSVGRTIKTLEENGAGTTVAGGVAFFFSSIVK